GVEHKRLQDVCAELGVVATLIVEEVDLQLVLDRDDAEDALGDLLRLELLPDAADRPSERDVTVDGRHGDRAGIDLRVPRQRFLDVGAYVIVPGHLCLHLRTSVQCAHRAVARRHADFTQSGEDAGRRSRRGLRDFYLRQLRDWKASLDLRRSSPTGSRTTPGRAAGRSHAHTPAVETASRSRATSAGAAASTAPPPTLPPSSQTSPSRHPRH